MCVKVTESSANGGNDNHSVLIDVWGLHRRVAWGHPYGLQCLGKTGCQENSGTLKGITVGQQSSMDFDIEPPSPSCPENTQAALFLWICKFWQDIEGLVPCLLLGDFVSTVPLLAWCAVTRGRVALQELCRMWSSVIALPGSFWWHISYMTSGVSLNITEPELSISLRIRPGPISLWDNLYKELSKVPHWASAQQCLLG